MGLPRIRTLVRALLLCGLCSRRLPCLLSYFPPEPCDDLLKDDLDDPEDDLPEPLPEKLLEPKDCLELGTDERLEIEPDVEKVSPIDLDEMDEPLELECLEFLLDALLRLPPLAC